MSAASAVGSISVPVEVSETVLSEKKKQLSIFYWYFSILKTVDWNKSNEALLDKYITDLTKVFQGNPITSVMAYADPLELGKTTYDMWEKGNVKESAHLIFSFFSNSKNREKSDLFCFHWRNPQAAFILHYLTSLPPNLDRIDFGSYHLPLNADAQIDLIVSKFPNVQSLSLRSGMTASAAIKTATHLNNLNYLCFCQCQTMTKPGVLAISKGNFPSLTYLNFSFTNGCVDDEVLITIGNNPHFSNLEYLHIHEAKISNKGLQALIQSPHLKKLKAICFSKNFKIDENIEKALKSRNLIN